HTQVRPYKSILRIPFKGAHAGAPLQVNIAHSFQALTCDAHHVSKGLALWNPSMRDKGQPALA
ncbi:MAG: hypothetical protein RBU37_20270, partial [Myxococcota bacterium]|nr:hypothetical protein [Myxococcota bacterium]